MSEKFRVGRKTASSVEYAFTLERKEDGGLRFTKIESISGTEQALVMSHFGMPRKALLGVRGEQHWRPLKPGTQVHFEAAVSELPAPFVLMGGE